MGVLQGLLTKRGREIEIEFQSAVGFWPQLSTDDFPKRDQNQIVRHAKWDGGASEAARFTS